MSHSLEPCLKRRPKYWVACAKRSKITNARTKRHGDVSLEVGYQPHKSFVLMVLVVAVQKRRPRVIGNEINFHAAEPRLLMVSSITPDVFLSPTFVTSNVCLCSTAR